MAIRHINGKEFYEVKKEKGLVLVDFFAEWCGPCKMLGTVLDDIVKDYDDKMVICKIDIDKEEKTAEENNIQTVPSVFLYKDGEQVEKFIGFKTKADLQAMIDKYL